MALNIIKVEDTILNLDYVVKIWKEDSDQRPQGGAAKFYIMVKYSNGDVDENEFPNLTARNESYTVIFRRIGMIQKDER